MYCFFTAKYNVQRSKVIIYFWLLQKKTKIIFVNTYQD